MGSLFAVGCQTIPTDLKDFLHNPAAPESRNDAKPELCAHGLHVLSQDGRGNLAHPAPHKGTATPCPIPVLLPPWGAGTGAAQLGRSQEIPNSCLAAGNHPAVRWVMVQSAWRGISRWGCVQVGTVQVLLGTGDDLLENLLMEGELYLGDRPRAV